MVCSPIERIHTTVLGYGVIYLRVVLDDISEFAQEWESEPLFGKPTMFFRTENSKYTVISLKDISLKDSILISCFSSVNRSIKEERELIKGAIAALIVKRAGNNHCGG